MQYSFDVIRDAWIPVQFNSGVHNVLSVRDVFKDAANIKCIAEPNVKYSYGIHNFLIALLASAYSITDIDAKFDIMFADGLDITIFDKYISECESKRPNCFNLFGENPFYQNIYAKYKLDKVKGKKVSVEDVLNLPLKDLAMIGKIALDYPSGNNSVHFTNDALVGSSIDYVECVKALLSYTLFQPLQDGPYNSANSVNGGNNYPYYFVIKGKTLLHTIVLNTVSESIWDKRTGGIAYRGNAAWERDFDLAPKLGDSSVSMVEGLTYQNRFILLDEPDKSGKISSLYFGMGRAFVISEGGQSLWVQPNASYNISKKKLTPLSMTSADDLWTDMGDFFKLNSSNNNIEMPLIVIEYLNMCSEFDEMKEIGYSVNMNYNIYYIALDGGYYAPLAHGLYSNYFPMVLLRNEDLLSHFNSCIRASNNVGKALKTSLFVFSKSFDDMKRSKWFKNYNMKFYDTMRMEYIPTLLKDICDLVDLSYDEQTDKLLDIITKFKLSVKALCISVYREALFAGAYTGVRKRDKSYKGIYGLINEDICNLNSKINKLLDIKQNGGEDTNE